jgi:ribosomal protein S18 acetylase RimI-like enzyme
VQSDADIRAHLETYYDAVPRAQSRIEDFGPLTLFVRTDTSHPYYARPTIGRDGATAEDVRAVVARQGELGVPQSLEWVAETTPDLETAVRDAGLTVHRHPLMVHERGAPSSDAPVADTAVRVLGPDDPVLASAVAVANLGFGEPGVAIGKGDVEDLEKATAATLLNGGAVHLSDRIRAGLGVIVAAERDGLAVCSGIHNPWNDTTEIVGVATLPAMRRQGLAYAVTSALVEHAYADGIRTVFLSAGDDDVARIYARIGFREVGTALIAESAGPESSS